MKRREEKQSMKKKLQEENVQKSSVLYLPDATYYVTLLFSCIVATRLFIRIKDNLRYYCQANPPCAYFFKQKIISTKSLKFNESSSVLARGDLLS